MRLPETGIPMEPGRGAIEVGRLQALEALTRARHDERMSSGLSHLDLVAIRIDGRACATENVAAV